MGQIDLFVGGSPWLALASGYLEQKDCLYIGSAKFCPGGHFGDNFHATSAGARKIKEEHHVTDGTWSNLGIAAVPGLRDIKMPQVALTLKLGTRLIDGRGTKWDFQQKTQCFLTFLILHCSKLLRSSTS